ncbi:MAG: hypothetical protein ABIJ34_02840 [archaeon]
MEILKERDMKLLSRKRVSLMMGTKGTPARYDILKEVAKKCGAKEDHIVIKHIYSQFGKPMSKVIVHVYDDKDKIKIFEHENLLKKHVKKVKVEAEA